MFLMGQLIYWGDNPLLLLFFLFIYFSSVLTILETSFQLTLGFHGAIC
jgi:hypothetical protein